MSVKRINCCVETKPCVKSFPKLMIHNDTGTIAIVTGDKRTGSFIPTVLVRGGVTSVGKIVFNTQEDSWKDYNEPLTLQNE